LSLRRIAWLTLAAVVALVALGDAVFGNVTWRRRKAERALQDIVHSHARFIDFGVTIKVVKHDPAGEQLIRGKPPLVVLRTYQRGGMVDTKANPARFVGPSRDPKVWYCSEDQEPLVLHGPDMPMGLLVYGSEGAGKTTCLAMWHFLRVLERIGEGREGGQTAPTDKRIEMVRREMVKLYRPAWYRYRKSEKVFYFADGTEETCTRIRLLSTHQQSEAAGSRVQGYSWSWCGRDEGQDQIEAHEDIESRGRESENGYYPQLITATAKDNPTWRSFRDRLLSTAVDGHLRWKKYTLLARRTPFVWPSFWDDKRASMSEREYRRRILAEDVGPERMTYPAWNREVNLRQLPAGARDITALVIRKKTGTSLRTMLGGHDPGALKDVTEMLRCYEVVVGEGKKRRTEMWWFVVDELTTEKTTAEQHARALIGHVQKKWGLNKRPDLEQIHVRADPYGKSKDKPDKDVYRIFKREGIDIMAAEYSKSGTGNGQIRLDARIEMLNRLFCDAGGNSRLFVLCDERRQPVAPKLVDAIESAERDELGRADTDRKDDTDVSHWPAGLSYALWPFEKEAAVALREDIQREIN